MTQRFWFCQFKLNIVHILPARTVFLTLFSRLCFQVMLPVGEDAVSSRQNWARLRFPQSEHEAADACVRAAAEQVGQLHSCGQRTIQVLHKVPDG